MSCIINHPDRLAVTIAYRHFPFLRRVWENDRTIGQDINQIGFLCFYESDGSFRDFYNRVQKELYYLSKIFGFRKTHKNEWVKKEVSSDETDQVCKPTVDS